MDAHFWEQPVQSAHSLDGLAHSLPTEPLPVTALPSGLSRTQQLLASQALSIPVFPSYDAPEGGVVRTRAVAAAGVEQHADVCTMLQVLDRALAKVGGRHWWSVLVARAKAQRMFSSHRSGRQGVRAWACQPLLCEHSCV